MDFLYAHLSQRATNLNMLALLKVRSTLRREMWLQLMRQALPLSHFKKLK